MKVRIPEIILRACRIPKKAVIRMGEISEAAYNEHIKPRMSEDLTPHKILTFVILVTILLPSFLNLSYRVPPATSFTLEAEVSNTTYSETMLFSENGVNSTVLLNNTPFNPDREWSLFEEYDFNRYAWNESDGYHMTHDPLTIYSVVSFTHREYIPIKNCSDVSIHVVVEGIVGEAGLYLEGFASEERAVEECDIDAGAISVASLHLPLEEARVGGTNWLCPLIFNIQFGLSAGAHIIIRSVVIQAVFESELCRVIIDFQTSDGQSLFRNPYMSIIDTNPQLFFTYDNDSDSLSLFSPDGINDTLYLLPGKYEGIANWGWNATAPDPLHWSPNVFFEVQDGNAQHVSIRMYTIRLDFEVTPRIVYRSLSVRFMDEQIYYLTPNIIGSTLEIPFPEFLYIPGGTGTLTIRYYSWSPYEPLSGQTFNPDTSSRIETTVIIDETNSSRNLMFRVILPYLPVFGVALGAGEIILLSMVIVLLCLSFIAFRRVFRYSNLRHRLNDTRLIPVLLLTTSLFVPWHIQMGPYLDTLYIGVEWVVWWATPLMVRWYDGLSGQVLVASHPWIDTFFHSTLFLLIPIIYGWFVIARPEGEKLERGFILSLLLPYLVVLSALDYASATGSVPSVGLVLVMIAFPVWVIRYLLKRFRVLN
ncbi:MAG: hypothetical protein AM325_000510 [Candidatus Thorarchaeota archaeon SMTZ1-45]|nr:MAG: hypothetical protein AM325_00525 [Candidatus Thorarchaeota archaeon SMTZ1-45]